MKIFRLFVAFTLVCFALSQRAQGVVPPPPGGYPNFTTAAGDHALQALTLGVGNTAIGTFSLFSVTTGNFNTAVGAGALDLNTADSNTATGAAALLFNTTGTENTAIGTAALELSDSAVANTAVGFQALQSNTTSHDNTAVGSQALLNTTGFGNTAVGTRAGEFIRTGSYNIDIGEEVEGTSEDTNTIRIGSQGTQLTTLIAGIYGADEGGTISAVYINSDGVFGTQAPACSRRFKKGIKSMGQASESILALKPVTFSYKSDGTNTPQFGLIAEEVAAVNPDLVVCDKNGEIYTVRYEAVNAMLLNEFLKEHRKVEEQQATITQLKKDFGSTIAQLTARLDEQAAQIQKVSAQLEPSKPAPQVVSNNQ
jgi:hypothetical protein